MRSPPRCRGSTGTGIPIGQPTELREAIAATHGVDPSQVFAANGSNEVLQTVLLAYAGPGRTVATFEPTYQMHAQIARVTGATVVEGERAADFTLDPAEVERVLVEHRPHVVFLTSPNNPTGLVEPAERVRQLLDLAPGLVVVDEAYAQFADWSALDLVSEDLPLVVTRTFSKTWSMAGARLGYLIGPSWLVAELDKVVLPYHLDAVKQIAGRLALRFSDDMNERVDHIVAERTRIVDRHERPAARRVPERRQLRAVPGPAWRAHWPRRVAGPRRSQRADSRLFELAAPRQLPARHGRHPR